MKRITLLLSLLSIFSAFAGEIISETHYVGKKKGFFGGKCELVIQQVEALSIYDQIETNYKIFVSSGDDQYEFLASEPSVTSDNIGAISGGDFFIVRPTVLKIDLDSDQMPVSLLITKERIGSDKLLACKDFELVD